MLMLVTGLCDGPIHYPLLASRKPVAKGIIIAFGGPASDRLFLTNHVIYRVHTYFNIGGGRWKRIEYKHSLIQSI
jgi:hypothetical protein